MQGKSIEAREALDRLTVAAARIGRDVRYMEVCGTHTMNAFRSGLHSLMPSNVTLLSGPGCPVCVTSQGDIDELIHLTDNAGAIVCTYGDMMRVPGASGSLDDAHASGADVRVIYSALDAVHLAQQYPDREVVLAAVGFETTAPATAVAVLEASLLNLTNFTIFGSHKLVMPAMRALLDTGVNLDGFLCPGHVAVVIGADAFRPVADEYRLPCVIAGFEGPQIAAGLARLCERTLAGTAVVENLYPQAVSPRGSQQAQFLLREVFEPTEAYWRGLGTIPNSGLKLRERFSRFDAQRRFARRPVENREPHGCRCGEVITGRCTPGDCKLFDNVCTPVHPIGPCMVSGEGTCQAWFKYHRRPASCSA
ncbi:hydrogenase formation protein HypD [soil metagenome]